MKNHFWTVNESGNVVRVGTYERGFSPIEIEAPNKTEATAILLKRLAALSALGSPRLFVKGGAYALAYPAHDGSGFMVEGGTLHPCRKTSEGDQFSLVSGFAKTLKDVPRVASLDYYGSEEYAENERKAYGERAASVPAGIPAA